MEIFIVDQSEVNFDLDFRWEIHKSVCIVKVDIQTNSEGKSFVFASSQMYTICFFTILFYTPKNMINSSIDSDTNESKQ